ncbi:MAG: beta galactosidase jelly roll domain-containing protein [Paludibacter sp.]|nr:beta galactosidase jelly roll domain-containing protein [Paludibacter sp.]
MKNKFSVSLAMLFIAGILSAQVRLPHLVGDNMILQRDVPAKIFGWAAPSEKITVTFDKKYSDNKKHSDLTTSYKTVADSAGNWFVTLPAQKGGGNYCMTISASNTLTINNITFGDVWLCSGQSNMETPISRLMSMYGDEIAAYSNPQIRYVKIPMTYNFHYPQTDVPVCSWVDLTPETAQNFSGVAYFFAKFMYEKTNIPVGIINSSVGGTPAEAWISEKYIKRFPANESALHLVQDDNFVKQMQNLSNLPSQRWQQVANLEDLGSNEQPRWYSASYNDSDWTTTDLFDNSWGKNNGFAQQNGVFWFRKDIDIDKEFENQAAKLFMGRIVDADSVFVNGQFVGNTTYQYPPRNYFIPKNILKNGKNTVTIRLVSQSGTPEFVREKPYKIVFNNGAEISLEGEWKYKTGAIMPAVAGVAMYIHCQPTGLYNAMIAPLTNFNIKGFVWYQGESNTSNYYEYFDLMNALIANWREDWKNKNLPFLLVQLCNFMDAAPYQQNSNWAALRNVQRIIDEKIDNTAMAVTIDLGEWNDIHPLNKKDIGLRLSLQARKLAYGENISADSPLYEKYEIKGNKIILYFREGTADFQQVEELNGFYISDKKNGTFLPAQAKIVGKTVEVWNKEIENPAQVRYAWANNPNWWNLRGKNGLPASPFQTE